MNQPIYRGVLALLLAGCAGNSAAGGERQPNVEDMSERAAAAPPIYSLLGQRETIGLTSAQITSLDSIATWLSAENSPLIEELNERGIRRDDDPILRPGDPPRVDRDGEPLLARLSENNQAASDAVAAVLEDEQKTQVCSLYERLQRERRGGRAQSTARLGVAPGFGSPDGLTYRWPWCRSDDEDDQEPAANVQSRGSRQGIGEA